MGLESVPSSSTELGSNRATRSQQRIRKDDRTWTTDTFAPYDDGHQWRKYGEKKLSNSKFPRFYYRCTYKNDMKCPATKQVQQKDYNDPPLFSVTYFNHHTCTSTSRPINAPELAEQSSPGKAVSICFNSCTVKEQNAFLPSPATMQLHGMRSYETNQSLALSPVEMSTSSSKNVQDRKPSAQFHSLPDMSSPGVAPVKMEVDELPEPSTAKNGVLSRTLLPIGQSRCIEYFQFL